MMKLSLMLSFFNTVDEQYQSSFANQLVERWSHDENSLHVVRTSANFICIFKNEGRNYFLRFNALSERELTDVEEEIKLLNYLQSKQLTVVKPILSLNERYIETFETPLGSFYACVFEGLKGSLYESDELSLEQIYQWGKKLGELHNVLVDAPSFKRPTSIDSIRKLETKDEVIEKELNHVLTLCDRLPRDNANYGLIHYDFESDNLIWGDEITMLDFDDCCYSWYVADILYALRDFYDQANFTENEKITVFLDGYKSVKAFDETLLKEHQLLMRIHKLYLYYRLVRAVDITQHDTNPQWMNGLIQKLSKKINDLYEGFKNK